MPYFRRVDQLLTDFFPGTTEDMKTTLLYLILNEDKYKSILDSYEQSRVQPTYGSLLETCPHVCNLTREVYTMTLVSETSAVLSQKVLGSLRMRY